MTARCTGRAAVRRGRAQADAGYTVVELVTVMFIVSLLMAADASVFMQTSRLTARLESTGEAMAQSRAATDALSRSMPYAAQANTATLVSTRWYVETLTTAVPAGAAPVCTQWRVDAVADVLQVRTWAPGAASGSAWTTVARAVSNDPAGPAPFTVYAADAAYPAPRISVSLTLSTPKGGTAAARGVYTLRNADGAGAVGQDVVCTELGRP